MAAPSNIGLQFRGNLSYQKKKMVDKAGKVLKLSFYSSRNTNTLNNKRRLSLLVTASSDACSRRVDIVNGRKDNAMHVPEAPPLTKLANESARHATFVTFMRGTFVEDRFVYRQIFVIRSYEIGPDKTVTMETLMNFLQETVINHVTSSEIGADGFGATREMSLQRLIWVVTRIQIQVQRYSKWGDEIEVDNWFDAAGKNGMQSNWIVRDHSTKEILAKAASTWAIMNSKTRRLSKMPEEVKQELAPFYFHRLAIPNEETYCNKVHKLTDETAERIQSGMTSMPKEVLEDYNMGSITLEYRRECTQPNLLESMTSPTARVIGASNNDSINRKPDLQYTHLLRLQDDKAELVRARTEWHLKQKHK